VVFALIVMTSVIGEAGGIMQHTGVNRRQAMRTLATGAVGAATAATWVESLSALSRQQAHAHAAEASMAAQDWTPRVLNPRQNDMVTALTELIIPDTGPDTGPAPGTPGAKAARVNRFVDSVLHDAAPAEREKFVKGLAWLDARSKTLFGKDLLAASAAEQTALLTRVSKEGNPDGEDPIGPEFFQAIKALTINGYYTSEIGLRQELGDDGQLFMLQFPGCTHPEHQ
jgi:Gluconate 2-dehydrogenase subunit 3